MSIPGAAAGAPLSFSDDDRRLGYVRDGAQVALLDLTAGHELRRLIADEMQDSVADPDKAYRSMDFSPDGRWLAAGGDSGVHLWDLATATEIATLPVPQPSISYQQPVKVAFTSDGAGIVSVDGRGLQRWPFKVDATASQLDIGPPQAISRNVRNFFTLSDTRLLGVNWSREEVVLLDPVTDDIQVAVPQSTLTSSALHPDGKWLATASWHEPGVKVWNAGTGELLRSLPTVCPATVTLSPDGQLLVVGMPDEFWVFETTSWEILYKLPRFLGGGLPGHASFNDEGNLLAINHSFATLQLVNPKSGQPIADLQPPHEERLGYFGFSRDGSKLAVRYVTTEAIEVWDLRSIRRQLAELGLDWGLPPYPQSEEKQMTPMATVTVDAGRGPTGLGPPNEFTLAQRHVRKGQEFQAEGKYRDALAEYDKALELWPRGMLLNNVAWFLVTCPDETVRDPKRAAELAEKFLEVAPDDGAVWHTLAVARYRSGDWTGAITALERSMKLIADSHEGFITFFLAMSHWQLGNHEEAQKWYKKAVEWTDKHEPDDEELRAFRAEAAELLGIEEEPSPDASPSTKNESTPQAKSEKSNSNGDAAASTKRAGNE
jgi:WD40 repeat protein